MSVPDVVELIKADHREVERLFEQLRQQPATRALNFPVLCSLLIAHSRAEESDVYPIAKDEAGETEEVAHSQAEHAEVEDMLERMSQMETDSAEFESALEELIHSVTHHVEEEEAKVLPGMQQRLSEGRRAELADAFIATRTEHIGDRPGDATRQEVQRQAANADLEGRSGKSKDQLKEDLLAKAAASEE
jgi:hemerythrin superfamily protein